MKFRQPSLGTKAVIFLPFLMSWTLTHFLMAELGCLASTPLQTIGKKPSQSNTYLIHNIYNKIIPQQMNAFKNRRRYTSTTSSLCTGTISLELEIFALNTYTFSSTIPLAWEAPPKGLAFRAVPRWAFLYCLSCHFCSRRWLRSFLAVRRPRHFPEIQTPTQNNVRDWVLLTEL